MGQRGVECFPEIWEIIGPMLTGVLARGDATWSEDQLILLDHSGYAEECYFTFSFSPIRDESGSIGGIFTAVTETTKRVLGERRLRTLRALAGAASEARTTEDACRRAVDALAANPADIPFALLYLLDADGSAARLTAAAHLAPAPPPARQSPCSPANREMLVGHSRGSSPPPRPRDSMTSRAASARSPMAHGTRRPRPRSPCPSHPARGSPLRGYWSSGSAPTAPSTRRTRRSTASSRATLPPQSAMRGRTRRNVGARRRSPNSTAPRQTSSAMSATSSARPSR